MKVSVYYFNCNHDITGIKLLISETGVSCMPHMYGDLLLTPEQEKILLKEGPGSEEGVAQAFLVGAYLWPDGIVYYDLDQSLSKSCRVWN